MVLEKNLDKNIKSLRTDRRMDAQTDGYTDRRRSKSDKKIKFELSAWMSYKQYIGVKRGL